MILKRFHCSYFAEICQPEDEIIDQRKQDFSFQCFIYLFLAKCSLVLRDLSQLFPSGHQHLPFLFFYLPQMPSDLVPFSVIRVTNFQLIIKFVQLITDIHFDYSGRSSSSVNNAIISITIFDFFKKIIHLFYE